MVDVVVDDVGIVVFRSEVYTLADLGSGPRLGPPGADVLLAHHHPAPHDDDLALGDGFPSDDALAVDGRIAQLQARVDPRLASILSGHAPEL